MSYSLNRYMLYDEVRRIDTEGLITLLDKLGKVDSSWKGDLYNLFLWNDTKEGYHYWYDIHTTIEENIKKEKANKRYNDPGII